MTIFTSNKFTFEYRSRFHCTISIKELPLLLIRLSPIVVLQKDILSAKTCLYYKMICEAIVNEVLAGADKLLLHFDNNS